MMIAIQLLILLVSVILHEISHGAVAYRLGDWTAKHQGRLSLNPLVHIDPVGSILVPGLLYFLNAGFLIGWAKPVPVNPNQFKNPSYDMMLVALAGPLTNFSIALLASFFLPFFLEGSLLWSVFAYAIVINIVLAVFNLLPVPPLDGSRILSHFLPPRLRYRYALLEPYGLLIVMGLVYFNVVSYWFAFFAYPIIRFLY